MIRKFLFSLGALSLFLMACRLSSLFPSQGRNPIVQVTPQMPTVYYGASTCGPTTLTVDIRVDTGIFAPGQVGLQYRLVGAQAGPWQQVQAAPTGSGVYTAVVALPSEVSTLLQGQSGRIEFRAYVADPQGNLSIYPQGGVLQVSVSPCQKQVVPAAQDKEPPNIINAFTSAAPVYYQGACTPKTLTVTASVVDNSGQVAVTLEYWFEVNMQPVGQVRRLPMQGQGTVFQATIPVAQEAAKVLQGQGGQLGYRIVATDAAGNTMTYPPGASVAGTVDVKVCHQKAQQPPSSGSAGGQPPASSGGSAGSSGSSGGTSGSTGTSLQIQHVRSYPDETYFGVCQGGETTWVEIEVVVDDISRVSSAQVRYRYELSTAPGNDFPDSAPMYREQGIGNYMARIDVGQELPDHAAIDRLVYYVEITTTDGKQVKSGTYFQPLYPCSASSAPQPPSPPEVLSVTVSPTPAYFGFCGDQSTMMVVTAEISNADQVQNAYVLFGYVPQPNMVPQVTHSVSLGYVGGTTFRVEFNLNDYLFDGEGYPPSGLLALQVVAEDATGATSTGAPGGGYVMVEACELQPVSPNLLCDPNVADCDAPPSDGMCDINNPQDPDCAAMPNPQPPSDGICDLTVPDDPDC